MKQGKIIDLKIINSAKFIKMPVSSRILYYDLITRSDDDGVVKAVNVIKKTGAKVDDLKILVSKGFVKIINDDFTCFVLH